MEFEIMIYSPQCKREDENDNLPVPRNLLPQYNAASDVPLFPNMNDVSITLN